ncbi:hypothetical protein WA158_003174 [Blastocystis sp. Blastoise]
MVCEEYGKPLVMRDLTRRGLNKNEIRIKVHYCGINHADILSCLGKYQEKTPVPFVPGVEVTGECVEVGKEGLIKKGDKVVCIYKGSGGFTEECICNSDDCFIVHQDIPLWVYSNMAINFITAYIALIHKLSLPLPSLSHPLPIQSQTPLSTLSNDKSIVITGACGGSGIIALQLSLFLHLQSYCIVSGQDQLDFLKDFSRRYIQNYTHYYSSIKEPSSPVIIDYELYPKFGERVRTFMPDGVDIIYDLIGGKDQAGRNLTKSLFPLGFIQGIPSVQLNHIMVKNMNVLGVYLGSYKKNNPAIIQQAIDALGFLYKNNFICPYIDKIYNLNDANQALEDMNYVINDKFSSHTPKKNNGKIILSVGQPLYEHFWGCQF